MTKGRLRPVYVRTYSERLSCWVTSVVGYRLELADGRHGPTRRSFAGARADLAAWREAEQHAAETAGSSTAAG